MLFLFPVWENVWWIEKATISNETAKIAWPIVWWTIYQTSKSIYSFQAQYEKYGAGHVKAEQLISAFAYQQYPGW